MKFFTYGTLKKGQCRAYLLDKQKFLGNVVTQPAYTLYNMGSYPGIQEGGATAVKGELWDIEEKLLITLDRVEGVDWGLFKRINIVMSDGQVALAYAYCCDPKHLTPCGDEWNG